jgi:putative endonuclease
MAEQGEGWTVYVLRSLRNGWLYIGLTNDVTRRLQEHNRGYNCSTKGKGPFELVHQELHETRAEARTREKYLKTGAQRELLRQRFA